MPELEQILVLRGEGQKPSLAAQGAMETQHKRAQLKWLARARRGGGAWTPTRLRRADLARFAG